MYNLRGNNMEADYTQPRNALKHKIKAKLFNVTGKNTGFLSNLRRKLNLVNDKTNSI